MHASCSRAGAWRRGMSFATGLMPARRWLVGTRPMRTMFSAALVTAGIVAFIPPAHSQVGGSSTAQPPLPAGTNTIGSVGVVALPALPAGSNTIGTVTVAGTPSVAISGTPSVAVSTLPALPAGSNAIGTVGVTSLPALPSGSNTIGTVTVAGTPSVAISGTPSVAVSTLPALPAGSNAIGTVGVTSLSAIGQRTIAVQVTPTVQAASYIAGQTIGGLLTLSSAVRSGVGTGYLQSVTVTFSSGVQPQVDVVIFSAAPGSSTVTDKTQIAVASADVTKVLGVAHITDCSLLGTAAPAACVTGRQNLPVVAASGTSLYAAIVARASATLTSVSDMTVTFSLTVD